MSWKLSKRQAQLKKRLIDSSHVYLETSHTLDRMLLKMLHNNGVYTPDDFYNKYIRNNRSNKTKKSLNKALVNLDHVLIQLKRVINETK